MIISNTIFIVLLFLLVRRERVVVEDDTIATEQAETAGEETWKNQVVNPPTARTDSLA